MNKKIKTLGLISFISVLLLAKGVNSQILPPNASEEDKRARTELLSRTVGTGISPSSKNSTESILGDSRTITRGIIPADSIYRKPSKKEIAPLAPEQSDLDKFADFLRQKRTGLIRLVSGKGCLDRGLVDSSQPCFQYSIPGNGASYSFRVPTYRVAELGDLTLEEDNFKCLGTNVQGIMTTIGDIPLEKVDLQTAGLNFLNNYLPPTSRQYFNEQHELFAKGVVKDWFTYRSEWKMMEKTTYVLRSIAYKKDSGAPFNTLVIEEDKRIDLIIAFRVVSQNTDGSITILWKELQRKGAPKLKNIKSGKFSNT